RPFYYRDTGGDRAYWPDNIGSEVTVTLTTSSGEHQLAIIALNPDATTPALTATMSTPVGTSQSLSREDAIGVTLTSGYIPLAAVHLYHGDATPRGENEIWDLRPWFEGTGSDAGTDSTAIHDNVAGEINAITEKADPHDDDELLIEDSEDSYNKKKIKISNLAASISFDEIDGVEIIGTPEHGDVLVYESPEGYTYSGSAITEGNLGNFSSSISYNDRGCSITCNI